jgi:hypothetical protein
MLMWAWKQPPCAEIVQDLTIETKCSLSLQFNEVVERPKPKIDTKMLSIVANRVVKCILSRQTPMINYKIFLRICIDSEYASMSSENRAYVSVTKSPRFALNGSSSKL